MSIEDDFMVTIQGQAIPPSTVSISKADKHVLEVDVEAAWKELALKASWSNEVEVKAYFTIDHFDSDEDDDQEYKVLSA